MRTKRFVFLKTHLALLFGLFYFLTKRSLEEGVFTRAQDQAAYMMSKIDVFLSERAQDIPTVISHLPYKDGQLDI